MDLDYKLIKRNNLNTAIWQGGKTTQLAIYPEDAKYEDRNFIWRVSNASTEEDISEFTVLKDYDRLIMIIKGKMELSHNDIEIVNLNEYNQTSFDGANETLCKGRAEDFNVMLRKDLAKGNMDRIKVGAKEQLMYNEVIGFFQEERFSFVIYCNDFEGRISVKEAFDVEVSKGDTIVINQAADADNFSVKFTSVLNEESNVIVSEMFY